jgi:hypothetical protein
MMLSSGPLGISEVETLSCGIWPLATGVDFEHVKVDLILVSQLKVHLPRFPLSRNVEENDTHLLVTV